MTIENTPTDTPPRQRSFSFSGFKPWMMRPRTNSVASIESDDGCASGSMPSSPINQATFSQMIKERRPSFTASRLATLNRPPSPDEERILKGEFLF